MQDILIMKEEGWVGGQRDCPAATVACSMRCLTLGFCDSKFFGSCPLGLFDIPEQG